MEKELCLIIISNDNDQYIKLLENSYFVMKIIIVHFLEGKMKNIEIEKDNFSKLMVAL